MGACLGQEALIATVVRISLRYGRIAQLEEGYGIPVEPLEQLAARAYARRSRRALSVQGRATCAIRCSLARMQKAMAILQFKLEGQTSRRNPEFELEHRNLLHRIDPDAGTVTIDGARHPLLDRAFPTIDWSDPYRLSEDEARCMELIGRSFLGSPTLWRRHAASSSIAAGCSPCATSTSSSTAASRWTPAGASRVRRSTVRPCSGRALFDALERVVRRAFRKRARKDVDLLYYLWAGPRSPLFGKDRMATFETYFVADKPRPTRRPRTRTFSSSTTCRSAVASRRSSASRPTAPLIVNGHVPVKLEAGESPLKKSGLAVTIDGAFSEAYGDHGFTLVIDADRTYLAKHHHFERGTDIVPDIVDLRTSDPPRLVRDTPQGSELLEEISGLEELVVTYQSGPR